MDTTTEIIRDNCISAMQKISSESMDVVITDPPYSSGGISTVSKQKSTGKKYTNTKNSIASEQKGMPDFYGDNKDQRSYAYWMHLILTECFRVTKAGGTICLFTDWRQYPTVSDCLQAAGFIWRGVYVWNKTSARPVLGGFRQSAEFILWGSKGDRTIKTDNYLPGLSSVAVGKGGKYHQTGKPLELMKDIVKIVPDGGLIPDPFMGAGTTGVAALEQGKRFIGVELSKHYFKVAKQRLESSGLNFRRC